MAGKFSQAMSSSCRLPLQLLGGSTAGRGTGAGASPAGDCLAVHFVLCLCDGYGGETAAAC